MNTEQRLRDAANEMERVTASLTPPPIGKVRRSARFRAVGVTVATAVGVAVLVGGAVLFLRPSGETTLGPAGPTETTETVADLLVDGIPVIVPELDADPLFDLGVGSQELPLQDPGDDIAGHIRDAVNGRVVDSLDSIDQVVFAGVSGQSSAYAFVGTFGQSAPEYLVGEEGECLQIFVGESPASGGCGAYGERGSIGPGVRVIGDVATFIVAGRAPEGSSVLVLEIDDSRYWQRTRDGYAFLAVDGPVDARVRYIVYDVDGHVLMGTTFYTGDPRDDDLPTETATTVASATGEPCSGALNYPSTYPRDDIPEPVVEKLRQIINTAPTCNFEALESITAEFFTASFGGGEPAELWTNEEEQGYEPMYWLMAILDLPHATMETSDGLMYIWPAAAAHDGPWDTTPEADQEALRALYDDDDFESFAQFGGYIGYRVGITENGDWSFFVAGD